MWIVVLLVGWCDDAAFGEPSQEPPPAGTAREDGISFDRDIRPILSNTCVHCHGPDEATRYADLRLDDEEAAKEYAIVPGDVDSSELIARILSDDPDVRMPPPDQKQQLTEEQIETLKRWIAAGAPWTRHWAYKQPQKHPLPEVRQQGWPRVDLDYYSLEVLEDSGLGPSPRADRETLIRRVTLDLTGLPPTLDEVDGFLADNSPKAYERLVDRLLASPRYGEHQAQAWLAAARYADTNGYQSDATRTMWPWRDWVVRAMNNNMPFDQFTIEQVAGDLLTGPDGGGPTADQQIATGFHRNHGLNGEGGRNPEESRVEYVIDRASTTGTVWMGLTVGCARCHDHKYDTLSQKEFYRLTAYFNSIDERGGVDARGNAKPVIALPTDDQTAEFARLRDEILAVERRIDEMPDATVEQQNAWADTTRDWLEREKQSRLWTPFVGLRLDCEHDAEWRQLEDGTVLVSEMDQSSDDYVVTVAPPAGVYHALRLEAFRHPKLTGGQFSTGIKGGFSVTDLEVELDGEPVKLVDPQSSFGGQFAADSLLDNNRFTTWSIENPKGVKTRPTWMVRFADPLRFTADSELTVRMKHKSRMGYAPIGRFRLAVTEHPSPSIRPRLGLSDEVVKALGKPAKDRTATEIKAIADRVRHASAEPQRREVRELRSRTGKLEQQQLFTMVLRERQEPRATYRLERGLWNQPDKSEDLAPGVPSCLPQPPKGSPRNRLTLARWLVRPDNPLTARVTVNRYWQHFFGAGLVKTSEDFGVQGDRPSHPKLLDWLAVDFMESGWDVKRIHKQIVMSATYQQSSRATPEVLEKDPYNRLLSRGPRFRLSAQALRDQALALSGLLVEKQGGPGVMPYQPPGVWFDYSLGKIRYKQGKGEDLYRRSLYTFWRRPVGPTLFFDNPGRQMCAVRPNLTNTPLHALTMLNGVTFVEAARVFAERLLTHGPDSAAERVRLAFRRATARDATEEELGRLVAALGKLRRQFSDDPEGAARLTAIGESPRDENLDPVELAAYTGLINAILNLDEVVTKG